MYIKAYMYIIMIKKIHGNLPITGNEQFSNKLVAENIKSTDISKINIE